MTRRQMFSVELQPVTLDRADGLQTAFFIHGPPPTAWGRTEQNIGLSRKRGEGRGGMQALRTCVSTTFDTPRPRGLPMRARTRLLIAAILRHSNLLWRY